MNGVLIIIVFVLCFWIMFKSVYELLSMKRTDFPVFSWYHFSILILVYIVLIVGFSLLYFILWMAGFSGVEVTDATENNFMLLNYIGNLLYFSTITMLTVGYGDITPKGIAKFLASVQALIGYLLPAAFFVSGIVSTMESNKLDKIHNYEEKKDKKQI